MIYLNSVPVSVLVTIQFLTLVDIWKTIIFPLLLFRYGITNIAATAWGHMAQHLTQVTVA